MFKVADFFDLSQTAHAALFVSDGPAWEALPYIKDYLAETLQPAILATVSPQAIVGENVSIGEGTIVAAGACIEGPAIIGRNCQIRHNAYIRAHVIVGDNCEVGQNNDPNYQSNGCSEDVNMSLDYVAAVDISDAAIGSSRISDTWAAYVDGSRPATR